MQFFLSLVTRLVRGLFDHFWLITTVLLVTSAVGWQQYLAATPFNGQPPNRHTVWDLVVMTMMLAPMKYPTVHGPDVPLLLNIGRVLLPFVFIGGMFKVAMLRSSVEKRVTQWFARTLRQHAVVCGLSQAGFALVCELLQRGRWVVLIDPKSPPALLSRLQQALQAMPKATRSRFALLEGDATSTETLQMAGTGHAAEVYAVSNDDFTNLDIATASKALVQTARLGGLDCQIHVHFKDYLMRDPLKGDFKLFDSRALAGRAMVNQYPADAPWLAGRDFSVAPHAMLIGLGGLGEQVVLQLARTAHYACGQRLQVTIVDAKASTAADGLFQRYPMLDPKVTPAQFGMPADQGNCLSLPILDLHLVQASVDSFCQDGLAAACAQWGAPGAIYVCLGNDVETDRIAKALTIALERSLQSANPRAPGAHVCTIVKSMRRLTQGDPKVTDTNKAAATANVAVVDVDVLRTAASTVVTADLERMARQAHDEYIAFSKAAGIANADLRPWETLDDETRQMNHNTTDHHLVRLREMGIDVSARDLRGGHLSIDARTADAARKYHADHGESFAAAEHRRWACDKLFFGWRYAEGANNKPAKLNRYLVGYENLVDDIQQYDRDNVARAFLLLAPPASPQAC